MAAIAITSEEAEKIQIGFQVSMFRKEVNITFTPLEQRVNSTLGVTGHGFIPCKG